MVRGKYNQGSKNSQHGISMKERMKLKRPDATDEEIEALHQEWRQKMSRVTSGSKNPMHGKPIYATWVEKYGIEEADRRRIEFKEKSRMRSSGSRNPMYGKPTPQGSGNGWSGWYKNHHYFRSLSELTYMLRLDRRNISFISAEGIPIPFQFNGAERTYRPDFLVRDHYLIEVKPKKLQKSPYIKAKITAAIKFCEINDYVFKIRDIPRLPIQRLIELVNMGEVRFTDRYKKKFDEFVNENIINQN